MSNPNNSHGLEQAVVWIVVPNYELRDLSDPASDPYPVMRKQGWSKPWSIEADIEARVLTKHSTQPVLLRGSGHE